MVKNHIIGILSNNLGHLPTRDQQGLMDKLSDFIWDFSNPQAFQDKVFIVRGYAGTGKTSVMSALVNSLPELGLKSVLLAPTGRAAKVLSGYSGKPATTIHKKIYRQRAIKDGVGEFVLDRNLHRRTLFIVDEASMIANGSGEYSVFGSGRLLDDLLEFVYSGNECRLILVGDTAQLPPVGLNISPALDPEAINLCGFETIMCELTNVVRQKDSSGILYNATLIRNMIQEGDNGFPKIETLPFSDIVKLSGADLIEELETCHSKYGIDNTMVICRSNKRAYKYNEGIRRSLLWKDDEISMGDYIMVVKNNYFWLADQPDSKTDFIANGDILEVMRVGKHHELYGFRFVEAIVRFVDYPEMEIDVMLMLDTLTTELAALSQEQSNLFFNRVMEDYADIRTKRERIKKVKENPYFNALQIKFSYAITCHKAQGGQWSAVFVDQSWFSDEEPDTEFLRWLYTAITRPVEKLYLVNFKDDFYKK